MDKLTAENMRKALSRLDELLEESITLIVGGGSAMILAHAFPLATSDIDAIAKGIEVTKLDTYVKQIAAEQKLPHDWLNPYFSTFAHTLPPDYGTRLIEVFKGKNVRALALGKEEMLIMKCFAHRQKDVGHAKALIRSGANIKTVEAHIETLKAKGLPGAEKALDFLDDVQEQI